MFLIALVADRISARLAEIDRANATILRCATIASQAWDTIFTVFRPIDGCLSLEVALDPFIPCVPNVPNGPVDCSTVYAEAVATLSDVTKDSELKQK
jgi:hypothetical protein